MSICEDVLRLRTFEPQGTSRWQQDCRYETDSDVATYVYVSSGDLRQRAARVAPRFSFVVYHRPPPELEGLALNRPDSRAVLVSLLSPLAYNPFLSRPGDVRRKPLFRPRIGPLQSDYRASLAASPPASQLIVMRDIREGTR